MNIEATNIKDFKVQFFKQANNDKIIQLKTSDSFWKEITEDVIKEQVRQLSIALEKTNAMYLDKLRISEFYHPSYGAINRI